MEPNCISLHRSMHTEGVGSERPSELGSQGRGIHVVGTSISPLNSSFPISEVRPVTPKTLLEAGPTLNDIPQGLLTALDLDSGPLDSTLPNLPAYDCTYFRGQAVAVFTTSSMFSALLILLGTLNIVSYALARPHTSQLTFSSQV